MKLFVTEFSIDVLYKGKGHSDIDYFRKVGLGLVSLPQGFYHFHTILVQTTLLVFYNQRRRRKAERST